MVDREEEYKVEKEEEYMIEKEEEYMIEREEEYVVEREKEYVVEREKEYVVETIALAPWHHGIQDGDSASDGMEVMATYFVAAVVLVLVVVFHLSFTQRRTICPTLENTRYIE